MSYRKMDLIVYVMSIMPPNWLPHFEKKYYGKMQKKLYKKFVNNQIDSVDIIEYLIKNVPGIRKLYIKEYITNARAIIEDSIKKNTSSKFKRITA